MKESTAGDRKEFGRKERVTIGIVGGGAAGMTAALFAARQGAEVTLLEGNDRLGKKLLSTGNGKCNLSNRLMGPEHYYTSEPERLGRFLEQFGVKDTMKFFGGLGLLIKEKNGYFYPLSEQAASVLDVLRFRVEREPRIRVKYQCQVEEIRLLPRRGSVAVKGRNPGGQENGGIRLRAGDESFFFDRVILACGGKAAPRTGSDGSGYRLARQLGHELTPVVPALVQLRCREEWLKAVAGVRAEAELTLRLESGKIQKERGELQLTDYGISGIPVFQLSRQAAYILREQKEPEIKIDFLPDYPRKGFGERMLKARALGGQEVTAEEYFAGTLNKKLMTQLMKMAGIRPSEPIRQTDRRKIIRVYELCRELPVWVNGVQSFENAQVCAGGVPLEEVTDRLESRKASGVYFAGELLDVDGRCGGYNLQWAWCSGYLTGTCAAGGEPGRVETCR